MLLLVPPVFAERLNFARYANQEGLPQRQVLAITQDTWGYLWVGTYGGLSRFNGRSFVTLRTREGLSSNSVQDIVPLPDGRLWVATSGGGVCFVEKLRATRCFHAPQFLTSDDVLDLEPDGSGGVWVGTFQGLTHLRVDGRAELFPTLEGKPLRNVWNIKKLGQTVLVAHAGGLAELAQDGLRSLPFPEPCRAPRALLPTRRSLYLGCENGLFQLAWPLAKSGTKALARDVFVEDLTGEEGRVWAATRSGLLQATPRGVRRITTESGLSASVIHRVFQDREGVLWLGTEEGLFKLVPGPFITYTVNDGLPTNFVRALAKDSLGRLWIGTRRGLAVMEDGRIRTLPHAELSGTRVYTILPLPSGELWVGTNRGVMVFQGGRLVRKLTEREGLPDRFTFALAADHGGEKIFIGTWAGMASWNRGKIGPLPPELAAARPLALLLDPKGRLWVGLRDGKVLVQHPTGRVELLGAAQGLSDQVVWSMAADAEGVWLGTNGDGAFHVTDRGVERWDTGRGLVDDFVWQVLPDQKGRVWFFTSQGLDRLENGQLRHFGIQDGLPDLEGSAGACALGEDGVIWFGTGSGLVRYDPSQETSTLPPPPILLESVRRPTGEPVAEGERLPGSSGLAIHMVSLSYRNEKALRFSYRLLPSQPNWSPLQPHGEVAFASLGPGHYTFEAVAVDAEGRRSPTPARFSFSVAHPWWQTPWAIGLALLLGGFATLGYTRFRLARAQARTAQLERLVQERTRELEEKAKELARLAQTDELTGLPNRRRFFQVLHAELQRLWRAPSEARLSLLLLDLDGFKRINDTLGHTAGDAYLKAVAEALQQAVRTTDTVARIGGDEFAVICPMTDRAGALVVAEKIRQACSSLRVPYGNSTLDSTVSVGLAVVAPSAAFSEQEVIRLVQRADLALYAAKRRGGNVFLDDSETWA